MPLRAESFCRSTAKAESFCRSTAKAEGTQISSEYRVLSAVKIFRVNYGTLMNRMKRINTDFIVFNLQGILLDFTKSKSVKICNNLPHPCSIAGMNSDYKPAKKNEFLSSPMWLLW